MKLPCTGASAHTSSTNLPSILGRCSAEILNAIARKVSGSIVLISNAGFAACANAVETPAAAIASATSHDLSIESGYSDPDPLPGVIKYLMGTPRARHPRQRSDVRPPGAVRRRQRDIQAPRAAAAAPP